MELKKLTQSFYDNNSHLQQALDNENGAWIEGKTRGYGIVVVSIKNFNFAIPLRSNIKHSAAYLTHRSSRPEIKGGGLDYSKALLINDPSWISDQSFKIDKAQLSKLRNKEFHITQKFLKYVEKYFHAVIRNDHRVLSSDEYRFSTLVNYHEYFGF
jgi:protein AbiQ